MRKKDFKLNKIHYIILAVVLIIGIVVRIWGLGEKSLWIDEIYSWVFSSQKTFFGSFIYMFADLSPPIYYLILYVWIKLFGSSEFMLRFPSFLAGIASVFFIYFATKKVFNKQIALGAAILTGLSPVMLYYSQEARPYSLFAMFSIITVSVWIEIINKIAKEDLDSKTLIKYVIFSLATILTHYWGLVLVFFQIIYLMIFCVEKKRNLKLILTAAMRIFLISGCFFICQYSFLKKYTYILNPMFSRIYISNPFHEIFKQIFYENYVFLLIVVMF
ncbi:MAG: glycosyltransferase family 39 protein, partial [bacterium]